MLVTPRQIAVCQRRIYSIHYWITLFRNIRKNTLTVQYSKMNPNTMRTQRVEQRYITQSLNQTLQHKTISLNLYNQHSHSMDVSIAAHKIKVDCKSETVFGIFLACAWMCISLLWIMLLCLFAHVWQCMRLSCWQTIKRCLWQKQPK